MVWRIHLKFATCLVLLKNGRGGEIRTHDLLYPKQARYQATLRPDPRAEEGAGTCGKMQCRNSKIANFRALHGCGLEDMARSEIPKVLTMNLGTSNVERRTSNVERRTLNMLRPLSPERLHSPALSSASRRRGGIVDDRGFNPGVLIR